jgi:hypothetical protein
MRRSKGSAPDFEERARRFGWDDAQGWPTITRPIQCNACVHRIQGTVTCAAFPEQIPIEILKNEFDHTNAYPGDSGIRFEPTVRH